MDKRRLRVVACISVFVLLALFGSSRAAAASQAAPFRVGVVADVGAEKSAGVLLGMLRHLGYPFDVLFQNGSTEDITRYSLLIIHDSGLAMIANQPNGMSDLANYRGNLLWVGPNIGLLNQTMLRAMFGVRFIADENGNASGIAEASSGPLETAIFQEQTTRVELAGARADGYFMAGNGTTVSPSETVLVRPSGVISYYFAYDVSDWWNTDPQWPWSRPAILATALNGALSNESYATIRAYPRNLDSAFIMRIEDVDPLHTSPEWVGRANEFLQEYQAKMIPLAVAYIPLYVSPARGLRIDTVAATAAPVRDWLTAVVLGGGTIVQHGYTHQSGTSQTGAEAEFLGNGTWLSYQEQLQRISAGKADLEAALGIRIDTFEAPHYKLNQDTLNILEALGYRYLYQDTNVPFFEFWPNNTADAPKLVVIPETLSYIPFGSPLSLENKTRGNIDQLMLFGGILLQYDHLYEDTEATIGLQTMQYVTEKYHVWTANTETMGQFEFDREMSLRNFSEIVSNNQEQISVGAMPETGLTIRVNNNQPISWVKVNGQDWPLFSQDHVILPALPLASNTIVIGFGNFSSPQAYAWFWGIGIAGLAVASTFPIVKRTVGERN